MSPKEAFSFRLDPDKAKELKALAQSSGRSPAKLMEDVALGVLSAPGRTAILGAHHLVVSAAVDIVLAISENGSAERREALNDYQDATRDFNRVLERLDL